jgi:competence protein ComEA
VAAATQSVAAASSIVVSVVGLVARPGLVTLSEGARVADALREVGGPSPGADLGALNLARRLADGEQIYVGVPTPPGGEPASGTPGSADKVDLNTATLAELDTLPGVGPVTAQRILDWRTEHGQFDSVDQLREIDGIGPSRFEKLQELVVAR